MQKLKETYACLAFIHQKMMAITYYPEDFVAADAAIKLITEMANKLAQDIEDSEAKAEEPLVPTETTVS